MSYPTDSAPLPPSDRSASPASEAPSSPVPCDHCGLSVPRGLMRSGESQQFCCQGCRTAYRLIHESGLADFYSMVNSNPESQTLVDQPEVDDRFAQFDEPSFVSRFVVISESGMARTRFVLDGIHCAACVWLIEKLPLVVPGVYSASVNWARQTVEVVWNTKQVSLSRIASALNQLGYSPHPQRESSKSEKRKRENRVHLTRIGVSGAAAGNNMLIAGALYLGMFSYMSIGMETVLRVASCAIGLFSLFWPGRVFIQGAIGAIRTRTPHMDLPIALALCLGSIAGLVNTFRGAGEIYFDSLSVLIFLLLVGRWIQFRQQTRAADAIELLYQLTPQRARKWVDNSYRDVAVEDVHPGDQIEIRPGDLIPVDAMVTEGKTHLDRSILSGESKPVARGPGDVVEAGTRNLEAVCTATATAVGRETRVAKVVELVEMAANDRPRIVEWANRMGGYFVATVMGLAVITFVIWMFREPSTAIDRSIALLIVACPCALALATPLAISVALGRLARRKIMVKSGDVIQSLNTPGVIWLDKTGTLTEGAIQVVRWIGDEKYRAIVANVERSFSHPIAVALASFEGPDSDLDLEVCDARLGAGGVSAFVERSQILIGSRSFVEEEVGSLPKGWAERESGLLEEGLSPCWIVDNGEVVAMAGVGDQIRDDSASTLSILRNGGWRIGVLSGDHVEIVEQTARQLGLDNEMVFGGMTPEQKLDVISKSRSQYATTVMVGDGVNDGAALAAATVGIAVQNGAEASLAAAPVYLARTGLAPIIELISASESTSQTIRINFGISLAYNAMGAGLAMSGLINPLVAALLMPISSLTVIALSLRSGRSERLPGEFSPVTDSEVN